MSSLRRVTASRANGARSRGPVTREGKARSSRNATRHGLLSRQPIAPDESDTDFKNILAGHLHRFAALPGVNPRILHEMALCRWHIHKARAMEKQWLDEFIAADPHPDPRREIANAFAALSDTNKYRLLLRREGRLYRFYEQSLRTLLRLQTKKDETNLIPFSDTLQLATEPPLPIHAPATKNDETNLIPFPHTARNTPEPYPAPLHCRNKTIERTQFHPRQPRAAHHRRRVR